MYTYSEEHLLFLKKRKRKKLLIFFFQILIIISFLAVWEILARKNIINTFLFSSPSNVYKCLMDLYHKNGLFNHIWITTYETLISFALANVIGIVVGSILWWNNTLAKVVDPYLTVINSLPKVALGPLIIIWVGAGIISIINIYSSFVNTDSSFITLMKSFKASKWQIYKKVILPSNLLNIINNFKINISMSLIGVIMGELLVSKEGLGYLIMYGSQIFNINLVIASVVILGILSYFMYYIIHLIEKKLEKK